MALSTALGVAWVMKYFSLMASRSASLIPWLITSQALKQLWTLVHNTSAVKDISSAGFILQQQRKGGLTFVPKRANILQMHLMQSKWRQTPTKLLELGYQFFGNCFCETIYGMGVWSQSCWSGQIPTHFLTISLKEYWKSRKKVISHKIECFDFFT